MGKFNNVLYKMLLLLIVLNLCHEHTINFYIIRHVPKQINNIGITCSIIIYGNTEFILYTSL